MKHTGKDRGCTNKQTVKLLHNEETKVTRWEVGVWVCEDCPAGDPRLGCGWADEPVDGTGLLCLVLVPAGPISRTLGFLIYKLGKGFVLTRD